MAELYKTTLKVRRGLAEAWEKNNPILQDGEPGFASDIKVLKIGDGRTPWMELKEISGAFVESQPDWNQNDPAGVGYINNRPFYEDGETVHHLDIKFMPSGIAKVDEVQTIINEQIEFRLSGITSFKGTGANSAKFNDPANEASGAKSFAEGDHTHAIGKAAHSEGCLTYARDDQSHAEGDGSVAYTVGSHAEGYNAKAGGKSDNDVNSDGRYAHAEGNTTVAYGRHSHAEGRLTLALNREAHAEGDSTIAGNQTPNYGDASPISAYGVGAASHAEGIYTNARGAAAHAEGYKTVATGNGSHAEGESTLAQGGYAHAEGGGVRLSAIIPMQRVVAAAIFLPRHIVRDRTQRVLEHGLGEREATQKAKTVRLARTTLMQRVKAQRLVVQPAILKVGLRQQLVTVSMSKASTMRRMLRRNTLTLQVAVLLNPIGRISIRLTGAVLLGLQAVSRSVVQARMIRM